MPKKPKIQELWCKPGVHFYKREAIKGRKPIACDEHRHLVDPVPAKEELFCKSGHTWERRSGSKGRKPQYCPDHAPKPPRAARSRTAPQRAASEPVVETLYCQEGDHDWEREVKKGKKPLSCPKHTANVVVKTPSITLEELERDYKIPHEELLKLEYCDKQLSRERPADDQRFTMETRNAIVRRLRRKDGKDNPFVVTI